MSEPTNDSEGVEPCPFCKEKVVHYYEGSHDWCYHCAKCGIEKTIYVPHVEGEGDIANAKWNEWSKEIESMQISVDKIKELEEENKDLLNDNERWRNVFGKLEALYEMSKDKIECLEDQVRVATHAFQNQIEILDYETEQEMAEIAKEVLARIEELKKGKA